MDSWLFWSCIWLIFKKVHLHGVLDANKDLISMTVLMVYRMNSYLKHSKVITNDQHMYKNIELYKHY
jgi:hypothetical protein